MEAGGQVVGKVAGAGLRGAGKAARRLYRSTLKPSTTYTPKEVARLVEAGLEKGVAPTEKGLAKLKSLLGSINRRIDEILTAAKKAGDTVDREEVLRGLEQVKKKYRVGGSPEEDLAVIDKVADSFRAYPEKIPAKTAQEIKKGLYERVYEQTRGGQIQRASYQGIANRLMRGLEERYSEIGPLNKEQGPLLELRRVVERAIAREANKNPRFNPFSLNDPMHINHILNMPTVKTALARALNAVSRLAPERVAAGPMAPQRVANAGVAAMNEAPAKRWSLVPETLPPAPTESARPGGPLYGVPGHEFSPAGRRPPAEPARPGPIAQMRAVQMRDQLARQAGVRPAAHVNPPVPPEEPNLLEYLSQRPHKQVPSRVVLPEGREIPALVPGQPSESAVPLASPLSWAEQVPPTNAPQAGTRGVLGWHMKPTEVPPLTRARLVEGVNDIAESSSQPAGGIRESLGGWAKMPPEVESETLYGWIKGRGGLANDPKLKGELEGFSRMAPGLVRRYDRTKMLSLDQLTEMATKEGWLPKGAQESDLLELLRTDLRNKRMGKPRIRLQPSEHEMRVLEEGQWRSEGGIKAKELADDIKPGDRIRGDLGAGEDTYTYKGKQRGKHVFKDHETVRLAGGEWIEEPEVLTLERDPWAAEPVYAGGGKSEPWHTQKPKTRRKGKK